MWNNDVSISNQMRIGVVSYLNSKPLVEGLQSLLPKAILEFDTPSRLSTRMKSGEFDIGLIPSVEFLAWENSTFIGGIAVACFGQVQSVCIHSKKPLNQIRSMALDEGSKTSIALMRVIFEENNWKLNETKSFPMDGNPHDIHSDAVLLIGDRAMADYLPGFPFKMDLGEEWKRLTGLPFVFALWAVRPGLKLSAMEIKAFHEALNLGKKNIRDIATRESTLLGKDSEKCFLYLTNNIKFDLGTGELTALSLFQTKLVGMGLIKGRNFHEVDQLGS